MITHVGLGLGAGLVSALLFSVVSTGAPLGVVLLYLTPLPILIVALGWHHLVGLLALAIGALATSLILSSSGGTAFALGPALPAWWLAYTASRYRPPTDGLPFETGWSSASRLLLWVGLCGALVALVTAVAIGNGDHDRYTDLLGRLLSSLIRYRYGLPRDAALPDIAGMQGSDLVDTLVFLAPAGLACVLTLAFALNLWSAAKIVAVSGRLLRPWPSLPDARMPVSGLLALGGGLLLSLLPGFPGVAGVALTGGLGMAFALQGFAFLHDVSRGKPGRIGVLSLAYFLTLVFGQVFLPVFALLGLVDTATPIRRTLAGRPPGGTQPPPVSPPPSSR